MSEREYELEQDLARFDWHSLDYDRPIDGQMVIATDGVARWMDMFLLSLDRMTWLGHTATHWHAVREIPDNIKPKPAPVEEEIKF